MDILEQLLSRQSHNKLTEPGPTDEQLEVMFKAALRAPDHALLKPWRYRIYSGHGRERLAEYFVQAAKQSSPDISAEKLTKVRAKPMRAPMVIVASVCVTEHPKVPEIEQVLSGGASVQNLLMAAHFQGVGAIWRTGEIAFNQHFMNLLGCAENEKIIGFIYLGKEIGERRPLKLAEISDYVTRFDK